MIAKDKKKKKKQTEAKNEAEKHNPEKVDWEKMVGENQDEIQEEIITEEKICEKKTTIVSKQNEESTKMIDELLKFKKMLQKNFGLVKRPVFRSIH